MREEKGVGSLNNNRFLFAIQMRTVRKSADVDTGKFTAELHLL